MMFKTKQEAMEYVAKDYIKPNCIVVLDYSDEMMQLINDWYEAEDYSNERIIIEEKNGVEQFYYYRNFKLFPKEKDKVYIGLAAFILGWHKQYLNYLIEKKKRDSDSYVFAGYVTKDQMETGNAILKSIAKYMF